MKRSGLGRDDSFSTPFLSGEQVAAEELVQTAAEVAAPDHAAAQVAALDAAGTVASKRIAAISASADGKHETKSDRGGSFRAIGSIGGTADLPAGSRVVRSGPLDRASRGVSGHGKLAPPKTPPYFRGNQVRTAKYTWYSFFPVALLYQFRRLGNQYFLLQTLVMVLGEYTKLYPSPLKSWSQIAVLSFVLGLNLLFEARDDIFRHKKDHELNNSNCTRVKYTYIANSNHHRGSAGSRHGSSRFGSRDESNDGSRVGLSSSSRMERSRSEHKERPEGKSSMLSVPLSVSALFRSARSMKWSSKQEYEQVKNLESVSIVDCRWSEVVVSDLLLIRQNDSIPADMVVLSSSANDGVCYVETANIDGETNLKMRNTAVPSLIGSAGALGFEGSLNRLTNMDIELCVEKPNRFVDKLNGRIQLGGAGGEVLPVSGKNLLIRGSVLKNTAWVIGLCIYTGNDTKVMQNATETPSKLSNIDKILNKTLYMIVFLQALMVTFADLAGIIWQQKYLRRNSNGGFFENELYYSAWYLEPNGSKSVNEYVFPSWLADWLSFFILFNNFLPINLYVILDFVNMLQAIMITNDLKMYDPITDQPATCRSTNLCQEIGQVQHIFSDKTGTLTQNVMHFRTAAIHHTVYGSFPSSSDSSGAGDSSFRTSQDPSQSSPSSPPSPSPPTSPSLSPPNTRSESKHRVDGSMSQLWQRIQNHQQQEDEDSFAMTADRFLSCLAVAHTLVRDQHNNLQAESPDEMALVEGAAKAGYIFEHRVGNVVTVKVNLKSKLKGDEKKHERQHNEHKGLRRYVVLGVNTFTSKRKRMSVVVRCPDGRVRVLVKGADNVVFSRLRDPADVIATDEPNVAEINIERHNQDDIKIHGVSRKADVVRSRRASIRRSLDRFALQGLRTLAVAERTLSEHEAEQWKRIYDEANARVEGRKKALEDCADLVEKQLTLLGATGIEDKLQDKVAQTITDIQAAGISFWVLTGDKLETAINIGYSSGVLFTHSKIYKIDPELPAFRVSTDNSIASTSNPTAANTNTNTNINTNTNTNTHINTAAANTRSSARRRSVSHNVRLSNIVYQHMQRIQERQTRTRETSVSGHAYNLFRRESASHFPSLVLEEEDVAINSEQDRKLRQSMGMGMDKQAREQQEGDKPLHEALVVTGRGLELIMDDRNLREMLLEICQACQVVIACRVSPLQKAKLVRMVRRGVKPEPITLAIGDGANDVGMIQEAHIGIGISGKEGRQAVNASDFAIAQFRFLKRLLLVHGRWNYRRICKVIAYVFYKNFTLTLTLLIYACMAGISGTSLYESLLYNGFNFFTMFPIIAVGCMDQDVRAETVESFPVLYMSGRLSMDLNFGVIMENIVTAIIHASIVILLPWLSYSGIDQAGVGGIYVFGTIVFSCLVFLMQYRVMLITATYTRYTFYALLFSFVLYFTFLLSYGVMDFLSWDFYKVPYQMMNAPIFWIVLFGVPGTALYFDFVFKYIRRELFPNLMDIATEADYAIHGKTSGLSLSALGSTSTMKTSRYQMLQSRVMNFLGLRMRQELREAEAAAAQNQEPNQLTTAAGRPSSQAPRIFDDNRRNNYASDIKQRQSDLEYPSVSIGLRDNSDRAALHRSMSPMSPMSREEREREGALPIPGAGGARRGLHSLPVPSNFRVTENRGFSFAHPGETTKPKLLRLTSGDQFTPVSIANIPSNPNSPFGLRDTPLLGTPPAVVGHSLAAERGRNEDRDQDYEQKQLLSSEGRERDRKDANSGAVQASGTIATTATTTQSGAKSPEHQFKNRPKDWDVYQQTLPRWQEPLKPRTIIITLFVVSIAFFLLGALVLEASSETNTVVLTYEGELTSSFGILFNLQSTTSAQKHKIDCSIGSYNEGGRNCTMNIVLDRSLKAPIYLNYLLTQFYQNYYSYTRGRSLSQLKGEGLETDECENFVKDSGKTFYPCGAIARSMFNDSFSIMSPGISVRTDGIAWAADSDKYHNVRGYPGICGKSAICLNESYPDIPNILSEGVRNEHFMVWNRIAALPDFQKRWGRIDDDIPAGTNLTIRIDSNFPVSSFHGSKSLVLASNSWIGGRNIILGLSYVSIAALIFLTAVIFVIKQLVCPRRMGSVQLLEEYRDDLNVTVGILTHTRHSKI